MIVYVNTCICYQLLKNKLENRSFRALFPFGVCILQFSRGKAKWKRCPANLPQTNSETLATWAWQVLHHPPHSHLVPMNRYSRLVQGGYEKWVKDVKAKVS